ncbi:MAG: beta-N-acetylhexosaminidase [Bacteroidales bacterium]|nr:beta-N-acetylhexosaminidase [Bacteroidales bacterium]
MKIRLIALAAALLAANSLFAQSSPKDIIPAPVQYEITQGTTRLPQAKDMDIRIGEKKFFSRIKGFGLEDWQVKSAYYLELTPKGLHIEAADQEGFFYAIQSAYMMNFVSPDIQCCKILDWPRFRHRGMMLDVSRNFQPKEFVMKQLDMMALLKMNRFHFHLVDHPGWRIQIDKYPLLTSFSAWRTKNDWQDWIADGQRFLDRKDPAAEGGFYTKKDIADILAYAAARHIEVIPEIEMPGHNFECIAAYPYLSCMDAEGKEHLKRVQELCPGNEQVYEFLQNVLKEVFAMFPSKYIHIGGDEAGKGNWAKCPVCQAKMKAEGLKSVEELQSYLIKRMEKFANDNGKTIIGWDEILEGGLAPNATVMSWRGTEGGHKAIADGHDVIFSPTQCYYLDYMQARDQYRAVGAYQPLKQTYSFEPIDENIAPENVHHVLGVQGNLWTEFVNEQWHAETMLYPRLFAIAETGWSQPEKKDYDAFRTRAMTWNKVLDYLGYCHYDLAPKEKDGN